MDQVGYLVFTKDALDWHDDPTEYKRETTRVVAGLEWLPAEGHVVEVSVNQGVFEQTSQSTSILLDRFYAAMDTVADANGNPVCRSDLDPTASFPVDFFAWNANYSNGSFYDNNFYTFSPGDGQCQPLNPFGTYAASPEAQDFITERLRDELKVEQFVLNRQPSGRSMLGDFDGPIGYAAGIEYPMRQVITVWTH